MSEQVNYATDEEIKKFDVETDDAKHYKLPPLPVPLYKANPKTDPIKFQGDKKDIPRRVAHKLYNTWLFWINLRCNERLENILKKESNQDSDEFIIKATIVQILDHVAKLLIDGDLLEEITALIGNRASDDDVYSMP